MTRDEFKIIVKGMKAVYPMDTFIPDQDAFSIWYELLKDIEYNVASVAVQKHMMTSPFPPRISDIREKSASIVNTDDDISELEAWSIVKRAISRSGYYASEEFEKLPGAIKMAVGSPENLKEWSQMDVETVQSVEQSHFIRSYRASVTRIRDDVRLPENMRKLDVTKSKGVVGWCDEGN